MGPLLPRSATPRVRNSQGPQLPGSATPRVRHYIRYTETFRPAYLLSIASRGREFNENGNYIFCASTFPLCSLSVESKVPAAQHTFPLDKITLGLMCEYSFYYIKVSRQ